MKESVFTIQIMHIGRIWGCWWAHQFIQWLTSYCSLNHKFRFGQLMIPKETKDVRLAGGPGLASALRSGISRVLGFWEIRAD